MHIYQLRSSPPINGRTHARAHAHTHAHARTHALTYFRWVLGFFKWALDYKLGIVQSVSGVIVIG